MKPLILDCISGNIGEECKFSDLISYSGKAGNGLVLSGNSRLQKLAEWKSCQEQPLFEFNHTPGEIGTKEAPFDNINEAVNFLLDLEKKAIKEDLFLNSSFNRLPYALSKCCSGDGKYESFMYSLPWASPYTAFRNNMPDSSFIVTQLDSRNERFLKLFESRRIKINPNYPCFVFKPNLRHRKFLFRGQYKDFGTCRPSLLRPDENGRVPEYFLCDMIKNQELACLISQHPLVQLLGLQGVKIFNEPFRFQFNVRGLAQHYYGKTSLMDLTSDIETAKFFAIAKYDFDSDSFSVYDEEELGVLYFYEIKMPDAFCSQKNGCMLTTIGKQYFFARSELQSGFLLDMPRGIDFEALKNVHKVYFRHDMAISAQIFKDADEGLKYYPKEPLRKIWWNKQKRHADGEPFEVSPSAIKLNRALNDTESYNSIVRKLHSLGNFRVSAQKNPEFPDEVMEDYYADAPRLWSEFCKNIHFVGSEGVVMKEALAELPSRQEYRWAFYG